jgi:hypothetical protein
MRKTSATAGLSSLPEGQEIAAEQNLGKGARPDGEGRGEIWEDNKGGRTSSGRRRRKRWGDPAPPRLCHERERASEGFVPDLQSSGSLSQGSGWNGLG